MEDVYRSIHALNKASIAVTFNLLIFHPHATLKEIDDNIVFMKENKNLPFDFGRAEIVAGSPLERIAVKENRLTGEWPNWDYRIEDETVERMFRINASTFRRRNSPYTRMVQSLIALSYHASLLRIYKGPVAYKLFKESRKLINRVNTHTIDKIEEMHALTLNPNPEKEIEEFYGELSTGYQEYLREGEKLTNKMLRLQVTERTFKWFGIGEMIQNNPLLKNIFHLNTYSYPIESFNKSDS